MSAELFLASEEAQLEAGAKLAEHCSPPAVIFLQGSLGAGKTTFVRGFLRGRGYEGKVKSPTYNLVEIYDLESSTVFHFDFYRIQAAQELDFIGIQDYWTSSAIFIVEWPEKAAELLPPVDLTCHLEVAGTGRRLRMEASTDLGKRLVSAFTS